MQYRITNRPSPEQIMRIDCAAIPAIDRMMRTGICVNRDALSDLSHYFARECLRLEDEIEALVGARVNPGSHPQVRQLLFRQLRVQDSTNRKFKMTKSGLESTGKLEIEPYLGVHPVVRMILDHRERAKLKGTYADGLLERARLCSDGAYRVFFDIKPCSVRTGRYAGEDPNPMNFPVRTELGRRIKACFIPSPGCRLYEVDFSQIEMRVAAHEAQPAKMMETFRRGGDIHTETAMRVFKLPRERIDEKLHRYPMKRTGFGVLYLITGEGLMVQLNSSDAQDPANPHLWTEIECDQLIEGWYDDNFEIREWHQEQFTFMRRYGIACTMFGRIRRVPEVKSVHGWIQDAGLRQGANTPIQGAAADLFKMALARLYRAYAAWRELHTGSRLEMLVPVHDAVLGEVEAEYAEEMAVLTRMVMEDGVRLRVPIVAESKVGATCEDGWASLRKVA